MLIDVPTLSENCRDVVIRFSHVDAAQIVFYPRYIEFLAAAWPELPMSSPPFELRMAFRKANMLGDTLRLVLNADDTALRWHVSGQHESEEHMSIEYDADPEVPLPGDAHQPDLDAFLAEPVHIAYWMVGADGRLHLSRYFELINAALEQWFTSKLDVPFHQLHRVDHQGIPTVSVETHCRALPCLNDDVCVWLRPERLGTRSLRLRTWLVCDAQTLMSSRQVIVFVEHTAEGFRSIDPPSRLRQRLVEQLAAMSHE